MSYYLQTGRLWCFWIMREVASGSGEVDDSHGMTSILGSKCSSNFELGVTLDSSLKFNKVHHKSVLIQRIIQHLIDLS